MYIGSAQGDKLALGALIKHKSTAVRVVGAPGRSASDGHFNKHSLVHQY